MIFNDRQNTFVCFFNTSYKMSRNESLFYFVRECEIYNSFDCDEIKTTKKIERKLAIHQEIKGGKEIGMETPATL